MASEEVADLVGDLLDDDSKVFVVRDRKLEVIVNDLAVEIHELDLALEGGAPRSDADHEWDLGVLSG